MSIVGLPYIALYVLVAIGATLRFRWSIFWASIALIFIFLAFRHEVSTDWPNYIEILDTARGTPFTEPRRLTDPAYDILNWIGANWFGGIYFVNTVCALISVAALAYFCTRMPNPMIALAVAVPFLVIVVFAGLTRQGVATALALVALTAAVDRKATRFVFFLLAAALFHKTAFFMLLFAPFAGFHLVTRTKAVALLLLVAAVAGTLMLPALPALVQFYITNGATVPPTQIIAPRSAIVPHSAIDPRPAQPEEAPLFSAGALVRLLMTVVTAAQLLLMSRFLKPIRPISAVWYVAATASVALFILAFFYSTVADRVGFYLIGVQLYAMSMLSMAFSGPLRAATKLVILLGYGGVLLVWLRLGDHATNWLPYQSILLLGVGI